MSGWWIEAAFGRQVTLRWVPSHLPQEAVWAGTISPEDWVGDRLADKKANVAMKLHPKPKVRTDRVEHIDQVTLGILLLGSVRPWEGPGSRNSTAPTVSKPHSTMGRPTVTAM